MKFKDKIKAKEYKQAKEAIKECFRRNDWKKGEGEGWITERTYRTRRSKAEKLLPSFAFLSPFPTLLSPQPCIPQPTLPSTISFKITHKPQYPHSEMAQQGTSKEANQPLEMHHEQLEKLSELQEEEIKWEAVKIVIEAEGTSFYGLGEHAGSLQLNDLCSYQFNVEEDLEDDNTPHNPAEEDPYYYPPYSEHEGKSPYKQRRSRRNKKGITICWNTDVGLYSHLTPALYQSHPFLISILADGTANAYFFDSTYLTLVHLSKLKEENHEVYQILFLSRNSPIPPPFYIMQAKTPQEIAQEITRLFGSISLPPKWAIGYQQCRYSYYPDSRVVSIAESFRKYQIPCDVIWMDIHYMNEYRCFQFSPRHFPDPPRLSNALHSLGFHGVWMIDPGIKVDENYEVFKSGLRGDHFVLRHSPKEPFEEEIIETEHMDEPPPLEEYPEIKEAECIIDLIEEPGFNRAPGLEDQFSDEEGDRIGGPERVSEVDDLAPPSPSPSHTPTSIEAPLPHQAFASYGDSLPIVSEGGVLVEPLIGEGRIEMQEKEDEEEEEFQEKVIVRPKRMRKLEELEIGKVWPGDCAFPDFTRKDTRKWWGALYGNFLLRNGIDGVWNDMNEVASFGAGGTIHRKAWHRADQELGGPDDHSRYHNVYGVLMTLATKQGMKHARKDRREFVLTRANFMGGHRHAATWTGDNTSNWDHLGWTVPMIINLSLSGQLFGGADIGGFFGDATPELFARWMGIGALLPFARAHSCVRTRNHEPWSFGLDVKRICKKAIERRYRLLGYYYTLFYEGAHVTSLPILQPLFYLDPSDQRLRDVDSIFTIGSSILVVSDLHPPSHLSPHHGVEGEQKERYDEGDDRRMAEERRKEYEQKEAERKHKLALMADANPSLNADEDMVLEDEHLAEETTEEEEERKQRWKGRNDRFPHDLFDDRDQWIRFHVLDDFSDQYEPELPEFYLKRGAIVPLVTLSQHVLPSAQYFLQPLTLSFSFYPPCGAHPSLHVAEGNLYEDEGDSFDYQTLQSFSYVKIRIEKSAVSLAYPLSLRQSKEEFPEVSMDDVDDVDDEGEEKVTVYFIHLSNSNAFFPDRTIHVTEITHDNADHPKPLFSFHQSAFKESFHPAFPTHKVYSYVHHLKSQ